MFEAAKTVAIVGFNGTLGKSVLTALTSPEFKKGYKLPIRVLTGSPEKFEGYSSDEAKCYKVKYGEGSSYVAAFKGVDIVVDLTSNASDNKTVMAAANEARVKLYFLPTYGPNYGPVIDEYPSFHHVIDSRIEHADKYSFKGIQLRTGWFADFLVDFPSFPLRSTEKNKAVRLGGGDKAVPVTFVSDIGKAIASLAHRPPEDIPTQVCISGDVFIQNRLIDAYQKSKNVKLDIEEKSVEECIKSSKNADSRAKEDRSMVNFMNILDLYVHPRCDFSLHFDDEVSKSVTDGHFEWKKLLPEATKIWSSETKEAVKEEFSQWSPDSKEAKAVFE